MVNICFRLYSNLGHMFQSEHERERELSAEVVVVDENSSILPKESIILDLTGLCGGKEVQ